MSQVQEVCVDASVAVKVVVTEPGSDKADALFDEWASNGKRLIAPAFFEVETDSILRQKVVLRKELTLEQAEAAWAKLQALPIQQLSVAGQRRRAWEITADFGLATVYDATYLALAALRGCEFWTADERLFRQVKDALPFVKWLGDYVPKDLPLEDSEP
jgi:predicted nucleic acid-binding protein